MSDTKGISSEGKEHLRQRLSSNEPKQTIEEESKKSKMLSEEDKPSPSRWFTKAFIIYHLMFWGSTTAMVYSWYHVSKGKPLNKFQ
jgi:hypothetical protein